MCAAVGEKGPGFELRNQSQLNVMFRLFIKNKKIVDQALAPNNIFQWEINLIDPLTIEVYEPSSRNVLEKIQINAPGKTKYITWNPKKYKKPALYFFPQASGDILSPEVSVSRFNLDNNVHQIDIKRIRQKN